MMPKEDGLGATALTPTIRALEQLDLEKLKALLAVYETISRPNPIEWVPEALSDISHFLMANGMEHESDILDQVILSLRT